MDRRTALKTFAMTTAATTVAWPQATAIAGTSRPRPAAGMQPITVHGRVTVDGAPRAGVAISDGRHVVTTDKSGRYELATIRQREFVFVSLPGDVRVPVSAAGTASFFRSLVDTKGREQRVDFPLHRVAGDPARHAMFLLADPQVQHAEDIARLHAESVPDLRASVRRLADRHPFGVGCGDIMYDNLEFFGEWEAALREAALPGFQVLGNHDVEITAQTDEDSARAFRQRFGPTWYSFDRGEVHVVVLDDVFWFGGYLGYLDRRQLDWLAADLALVEKGRRVLVCLHIPPWTTRHERFGQAEPPIHIVMTNRELLYELLAPYQATVLAGHLHEVDIVRNQPVEVHVCGALCGAWWSGPICGDGTPNGYMIYEIDGADVRWRYQATGQEPGHQMRLYPRGADPELPGHVLANIWAADDRWRVVWYADGQRQGPMTAHRGRDPLAVKLYAGAERPAERSWVEPYVTDHLFICEPRADVREIRIEATDPWGRVFQERLAL
jgi:hypothetical protein